MNMSAMHGKNKDDGGLNFRQEPLVVQLGFSDVIFLNTILNDTFFYTTEYKYMDIGWTFKFERGIKMKEQYA